MFEKEIEELKSFNINPSKQRVLVLNYLNEHSDKHNTVDDIFKAFRDNDTKLSLATIYNTISLFKREGLISNVTLPSGEVKYERDRSNHIHFECRKCGEIYNMKMELSNDFLKEYDNFTIESKYVLLRGLCPNCKE
ncbi:Fur family transcriptional regulator [Peptoanaerobacter stomatis]|uniref:Ferric uptake regulator family protein n=1 Tax=Peptoanaerobacter stomatis TaxID=796937 RepID=G9X3H1_9FIRM|nr:Fur family transcriptional regulator [Peptoanaerobacter stomatis]EHL09936.1 hypothetical protein HMPREF9629_00928 [Peptoanaerobacter stomatis]EHL20077.1 hypothetical protein HMPREF9628_00888 [Peptoanaerobacter stomatis]